MSMENLKLNHDSNRPERATDLQPERIFLELWKERQVVSSGINHGFGTLELILNTKPVREPVPASSLARTRGQNEIDAVSQRDATVAASVIQWLGTKEGARFIFEAENRMEVQRRRDMKEHHRKYNSIPNPTEIPVTA